MWLPSREGGMDSKFQAMGRAIGVVLEVGKDIETHGDKTGEQVVTATLTLKKDISPYAGGTRRNKATVSGFVQS